MIEVSDTVRRKALAAGAREWLDGLDALVADLERDWSIRVGRTYPDATEAVVVEAVVVEAVVVGADGSGADGSGADGSGADGSGAHGSGADGEVPAVLKLGVPRGEAVAREITVLSLAGGSGCVRPLRHDRARGALLLPRLGRSMAHLAMPVGRRHEVLCDAARRVWRPAPGCGLPTGADQGRWLADFVVSRWEALGRPCSRAVIDHALDCAARRVAAHDDARAVLVHGDVHQWNALEDGDGFTLVDPDGLLAEPEYDLGVLMREDPAELLDGDPTERARRLAGMTGLDPAAVWEWGVVERVSTGLVLATVGLEPVARLMLAAAERIAAGYRTVSW